MTKFQADSYKISWVIHDSGMRVQEIADKTGLTRQAIYDIKRNSESISRISFKTASSLTKLYDDMH